MSEDEELHEMKQVVKEIIAHAKNEATKMTQTQKTAPNRIDEARALPVRKSKEREKWA